MSRRNSALDEAQRIFYQATDNYETGFITWEYKKQLLELKWFLDEALPQCSTYAGEDEWILEQKTKRALDKISRSG
jgi:hypothetical protein